MTDYTTFTDRELDIERTIWHDARKRLLRQLSDIEDKLRAIQTEQDARRDAAEQEEA